MKSTTFAVAAAAAALVSACAMNDAATPSSRAYMAADAAAVPPMRGVTPTRFVQLAGASDLYEITSGRMALERSQNADVRAMAQRLIDDHTMTTQTLMSRAREAGLDPQPPELDEQHTRMLAELQGLSGPGFDVVFHQQQMTAHQQALALHTGFSEDGEPMPLREAAASARQVVAGHLQHLQAHAPR
ncbi:MAG TPA: DUF4142 domain-containing protein [Caulobacteraceae bacterium]|jgi:putative membrane protein